jgi:hypothetical protein
MCSVHYNLLSTHNHICTRLIKGLEILEFEQKGTKLDSGK